MKKVLVGIVVASMMFAGSAFAAGEFRQNTGCGLGTAALGKAAFADTLIGNLVVTFLNGISGNQTFGITTGTSECKAPSKVADNGILKEFVVANMDNLAKDIAMGQGESLTTLAELMGIAKDSRTAVYAKLQSNFSNIFTSENVDAAHVVDNIITVIM
ncbi:MAG: hypothetical protein A3G39_02615 [Deltaproteobacteria bacterium RIFCSPLOWO2_12_FULL_43_16]|nr:MAG: hypothetical protein A2Z89_06700 [Deltaproteobacteria bacterium GWA2_43_19]OGQ09273.1 MAG: hypothetical protein A3D30_05430 [Deltaproteobacteria bacterium RIFCSPHIGHO2_02_FULL_43_33]OGQ57865.1 MAG: hypothetical protein A3G39_02615 [Deltaproteobacteria bacterium RIFCSPLOWO2_12_FULL_43_16]HBR18156.1 hypothetical protein [Deltaproteobacteria bacterium]